MDTKWRKDGYAPTILATEGAGMWREPSSDSYKNLVSKVRRATRNILDLPYEPEQWALRGTQLLELGYPELAVGDLYKALILVQAAFSNDTRIGENALLAFSMKIWYFDQLDTVWQGFEYPARLFKIKIHAVLTRVRSAIYCGLLEALWQCEAVADHLHMSREAMRQHPDSKSFSFIMQRSLQSYKAKASHIELNRNVTLTPDMRQFILKYGGSYMRAYPWMKQDLLRRSDHVFDSINADFLSLGGKCHVERSKVQNHIAQSPAINKDVYGVFASQDIKPGEIIFVEEGFICATNTPNRCSNCYGLLPQSPSTIKCCKALFCCDECVATAAVNYHKVICGKDLAFLTAATQGCYSHFDNLFLLRIVAASIREGSANPLHSSFLSRLTPQYNTSKPLPFSLVEHVVDPIRMLETLGIDAFANPHYDTWVLQTIRYRLANNISAFYTGNRIGVAACMPAYSMFNHSCEPNVKNEPLNSDGRPRVYALRGAKKGEELFVSYCMIEGVPKGARQEELSVWLGGPCMCSRCKREK